MLEKSFARGPFGNFLGLLSCCHLEWFLSPMSMPIVVQVASGCASGCAFGFGAGLVSLDVVLVFMGRVYHGARRA